MSNQVRRLLKEIVETTRDIAKEHGWPKAILALVVAAPWAIVIFLLIGNLPDTRDLKNSSEDLV